MSFARLAHSILLEGFFQKAAASPIGKVGLGAMAGGGIVGGIAANRMKKQKQQQVFQNRRIGAAGLAAGAALGAGMYGAGKMRGASQQRQQRRTMPNFGKNFNSIVKGIKGTLGA